MVTITYTPERAMYIVNVGADVTYNIYVIRRHHILVDAKDEEPREVFNSIGQAVKWLEEKYKEHIIHCAFVDVKVSVKETKYAEPKKDKYKYTIVEPTTGNPIELNEIHVDDPFDVFNNWVYKTDMHKIPDMDENDPYANAGDKIKQMYEQFSKKHSGPQFSEERKKAFARRQWYNGWFQEWLKIRPEFAKPMPYPSWLINESNRKAPYTKTDVDKAKMEALDAQAKRMMNEKDMWDRYTYIKHMHAFDREFERPTGSTYEEYINSKYRGGGPSSHFTSGFYTSWEQAQERWGSLFGQRPSTYSEQDVKDAYSAYKFAAARAAIAQSFLKDCFENEMTAYHTKYLRILKGYLLYKMPTMSPAWYVAPCGTYFQYDFIRRVWIKLS